MNNIKKVIKNNGIFKVEDIYEQSLIDDVKKKVKSQLNHTDNKERIESDKLYELGILDQLFNSKLKYLINTIMPDGVLWHCMFLKTKSGQDKPHIKFNTKYGDWHQDRSFSYDPDRIDFLDIMIYLNDVSYDDGPFAFLSKDPLIEPNSNDKTIKVIGKKGTVILSRIDWYHSATVNSGENDRYLIRFSFQRNAFHNPFLELNENKLIANKYFERKDDFMAFIFGINRNWTKNVKQVEQNHEDINLINPKENYEFNISNKLRFKNTIKKLFNFN
tara:strand:- start:8195 stop:9016 length:822 start_codon:yes stop_codon:yes gene_type:complete